jgi:RecA/RadA recombinase
MTLRDNLKKSGEPESSSVEQVAKKKVAKKKAVKKKVTKKKVAKPSGNPILAAIQKSVGKKHNGVVRGVVDDVLLSDVTTWIPTGFEGLNYILGGGWAVGRASEVSGPEGCGKSALSHMAIKGVQSIGGRALVIDFEQALETNKMGAMGIDPTGVDVVNPYYIEQAWDIIWAVVAELKENPPTAPYLIIWDSVGASISKTQYEAKSAEDISVGAVARAMGYGCKKMYRAIAEVNAHIMFINQERDEIGGFGGWGGPKKKTVGGAELKYACSARVRCARVSTLKSSGNSGVATGYLIKTTTNKCRNFPPHKNTTWVLDFEDMRWSDLTMRHALIDAKKMRSVGGGFYSCSWAKGTKVKKADWFEAITDLEFYEGAKEVYLEIVGAGGAKKFLESVDDEE